MRAAQSENWRLGGTERPVMLRFASPTGIRRRQDDERRAVLSLDTTIARLLVIRFLSIGSRLCSALLDRFIQQAVMQVLQADWDGTFSEASFDFRPSHSAHQAVERAQAA